MKSSAALFLNIRKKDCCCVGKALDPFKRIGQNKLYNYIPDLSCLYVQE
jgi:hypothetical protein